MYILFYTLIQKSEIHSSEHFVFKILVNIAKLISLIYECMCVCVCMYVCECKCNYFSFVTSANDLYSDYA